MKRSPISYFAIVALTFITLVGFNTTQKRYKQVKIGDQIWMAENLDVDHFSNGDPIPEAETGREWRIACEQGKPVWCNYDNDPENGKKYGKLYNWYALYDPRGLAPKGWHIPNLSDWKKLNNNTNSLLESHKLRSKTGWLTDKKGTNEYGFNAKPGGSRVDQDFGTVGSCAWWWAYTKDSTAGLTVVIDDGISVENSDKGDGMYVRFYQGKTQFGDNNINFSKGSTIRDYDGNIYKLIRIGDMIWSESNLRVKHFQNGDTIAEAKTSEEWIRASREKKPAWCYYSNDRDTGTKYGILYNWYAINDKRGLVPSGFSVPCDTAWTAIINLLGKSNQLDNPVDSWDLAKNAAIKMKCMIGWRSDWFPEENTNGSNESGLNILPGGFRRGCNGDFYSIGTYARYWTSNEVKTECDWAIIIETGEFHEIWLECMPKNSGLSVRCIRN